MLNVYLENGLRVVMHRIPKIKTVACGVWVKQGSKHEGDSNNGLSHLTEHLMIHFENDMNPNFQKLINEVRSEGVKYNAGTTKEYTYYYLTGLAENVGKCVKTLSSIVTENTTFPPMLLEREKKVVEQECVSFYSSFNQIKERTSQALWGNIGVGKTIVGPIDNVRKADLSQIEEIVQGAYTPENSVMVIVGDIDYYKTLEMIEESFGEWEDKKTRYYEEVVDAEPGIYYNKGNGGKSTVVSIGFRTPGYMDNARVYIEVISQILGDTSLESRLVKAIRVDKGLSYNLGAFANFYENRGTFAFTAVTGKESVEEVVKTSVNEFNMALEHGFTEEEMEKAKRVLKTSKLLEIGDLTSQLRFIGKCATYGHLYSLEQELRTIEKVELSTLNRILRELLRVENMSIAIIGECDIDKVIPLLSLNQGGACNE